MVAVERMPRECRSRITPNHSSDGGLEGRDFPTHPVHQYLGAAARHGIHPCLAELLEDFNNRHAEHGREVDQLGGRESVQGDVRMGLFHLGKHVEVPIQLQVGMVPALEEDLRGAQGLGFGDLVDDLVRLVDVAFFRVARLAVESAELAVGDADVGIVDVAVNEVSGDLVALRAGLKGVRDGAEIIERGAAE